MMDAIRDGTKYKYIVYLRYTCLEHLKFVPRVEYLLSFSFFLTVENGGNVYHFIS